MATSLKDIEADWLTKRWTSWPGYTVRPWRVRSDEEIAEAEKNPVMCTPTLAKLYEAQKRRAARLKAEMTRALEGNP